MIPPLHKPALRIALIYVVFSALWIVFSDKLLALLIHSTQEMAALQTVKGLFFVFITAGLIYFLLRRELAAVQQANYDLHEREKSFRTLAETAAAAIFIHRGGKLIYVNSLSLTYTGYTMEELLAKHVWELVHPDYQSLVKERALARQSGHQGPARYEIRMLTKQGEERWLEITADNIRYGGEDLSLATAYDITARKEQESKLAAQAVAELEARKKAEAAEQRIAHILEGVSDAFVALDTNWCYTYVNSKAAKLLGREASTLIGKHIWTEFPEGEDQPFARAYKTAIATQTPVRIEEHYAPWDRWFENRIVPSEEGLFIFFHDITERKNSENALRNHARHLRKVLDNLHAFVGVLTPSGELSEANQAALQAGGLTPADVIGKPAWETYWWSYSEQVQEQLRLACMKAAQGESSRYDVRIRGAGEELLDIDFAIAPLYDDLGNITHLIPSAVVITERVRAEAKIRALNAELEQRVMERTAELVASNERLRASEQSVRELNEELRRRAEELHGSMQELEAFSYSVSHDLRAPLRAVQGFSQALLEDYGRNLDSVGQSFAERIVASAARMDTLIQDLLAYSQLSRAELKLQQVSLSKAVAEALNQLQAEIKQRQALIRVDEPLPQAWAHEATLVQVIVNLISNAIKFIAPGVTPTVQVWAESQTGRIRLWIEDNGIGVPPEHKERIFRVFERLHGIETYPGTGIGLAIVKKAMERMGGSSGVECKASHGARFWVEWRT